MTRATIEQSGVLQELCALLLNLLHPPPPLPSRLPPAAAAGAAAEVACSPARLADVTPAGFASLLLGMSLALMLCGSVTFVLGFILMPWVLGLLAVFHLVGLLSNISFFGKSFFMANMISVARSSTKEICDKLLSKLPIL